MSLRKVCPADGFNQGSCKLTSPQFLINATVTCESLQEDIQRFCYPCPVGTGNLTQQSLEQLYLAYYWYGGLLISAVFVAWYLGAFFEPKCIRLEKWCYTCEESCQRKTGNSCCCAAHQEKKTFQDLVYRVGTFFCGCEGILCLCFGKSFAHTRRRILCRAKERSKALADKSSDGSIFTSLELLTKDAALKAKNGFGRTEPNNYPYLEPPDGRAEFSILNPSGFLTEVVGQRTVSKLCRICKTFSCVFILVGLLGTLGYYYQPIKDFFCFVFYGNVSCQAASANTLTSASR